MSPYAVVHQLAGGTEEQYGASVAAVHPSDGLPEGQVFHLAGPSADRWAVVAIHDSRKAGSSSATAL